LEEQEEDVQANSHPCKGTTIPHLDVAVSAHFSVAKSSLEELALLVSNMAFLAVVKVRMFIAHFAPGSIECCPRNQ
jgi:hypothetical protein